MANFVQPHLSKQYMPVWDLLIVEACRAFCKHVQNQSLNLILANEVDPAKRLSVGLQRFLISSFQKTFHESIAHAQY